MNQAFDFYGAYVNLNAQEKLSMGESQMLKYYKETLF